MSGNHHTLRYTVRQGRLCDLVDRGREKHMCALGPLGEKSAYANQYDPSLLFPIPRILKRREIGLEEQLPFMGYDLWTAYELSWLNGKGKPMVACGTFQVPCHSPQLIESKSLKLYLNSFNNTRFSTMDEVARIIERDLSAAAGAGVRVTLDSLENSSLQIVKPEGICLDLLDVECEKYLPHPDYLSVKNGADCKEVLFTNLLKSNCLVTGQPDWGTIFISYEGRPIDHEGLLKYIISLRDHNEFHEQCVERVFVNIMTRCAPKKLAVLARYTRRGGLDINPFRTNDPHLSVPILRLVRQ